MHFRVLFACFLASSVGHGLTLEEAQQRTEKYHPGLKALEAEVRAAEAGVASAGARSNPELSLVPGLKRTEEGGVTKSGFHGEVGLAQTFEFPGKRRLRELMAEDDVRLKSLALETFREEIRIQVSRLYFRSLAARALSDLRKDQVQSAETFLKAARKRVEAGYASDFESMKAQADLIAASKSMAEARSVYVLAKSHLAALMGGNMGKDFDVAGRLDSLVPARVEPGRIAAALARHPSIRAKGLEAGVAGRGVDAARAESRPDLTIAPALEYSAEEQVYGFGISMPLPFWNRSQAGVKRAEAQREAAIADEEKARLEAARSVAEAEERFRLAREQLDLYTPEFLAGLKDIMDRTEKVYGQSATTLLVYLEARRSYYESLSDYYEAQASWADGYADLQAALGTTLGPVGGKGRK
jgi:cobalt-zinc-cadmium efflux system outer membrane protein